MKFFVKPFAEITIKSRPVRRQFILQLGRNIRNVLKDLDPEIRTSGEWDNIDVVSSLTDPALQQQLVERMRHLPGIAHFYQVLDFDLPDSMQDIADRCAEHYAPLLKDKEFAVRCKRVGKHEFTSMDVEREVGSLLRQQCGAAGIRLNRPDVEVRLEIRHRRLLVEFNRQEGLGGYPLGSIEQALVLMSGGFDSTVAAYQLMRRGLLTHFCFFNLGGRAHELGVMEVAQFLWQKFGRSHRTLFISVPFEEVLGDILQNVDNSQMGVILKRQMLRAAEKVADNLHLDVLATGEAISQVSSQTLINLSVIDKATDKLVLRPLVAAHKQDIINTAEAIGTAEFAKHMPEYCGVISVNPTTKAKLGRIVHEEESLDRQLLERAVARARFVTVDKLLEELSEDVQVEMVSEALPGQVVIDIRHPDETEDAPLALDGIEQISLPFYAVNSKFGELDSNRQYLLYCDKGVMSRLHAHHLLHEGHTNVRVYRP
ncbi:tRNA uracil 4-sulfurtransferase ThiI [Thiopseudomonas denitrificans]|uniref:tRNA sulfurtransferase n=1 Tax=Thiopseudomonas denitrificans TaxID=1501432 RepID=A0A4R6TQV2_9GAMM|nr:tRNA uracil 4-sulfurtransferase ThiI [Thiopseudomonas denitrificans]TDQ35339.1 [ThiS-adenylate] sulfurtransferase [Thiopseudomonas denitrificans]